MGPESEEAGLIFGRTKFVLSWSWRRSGKHASTVNDYVRFAAVRVLVLPLYNPFFFESLPFRFLPSKPSKSLMDMPTVQVTYGRPEASRKASCLKRECGASKPSQTNMVQAVSNGLYRLYGTMPPTASGQKSSKHIV